MSMKDIRNKRTSNNNGIIKEGMEKLSTGELVGTTVTITDVDVINTSNGRCGVLIFKEHPNKFYFAGAVLTDLCEDIINDDSALEDIRTNGLCIAIFNKTSPKTHRRYTTFDFA